jgi:MFS transporter, DHA2 family, glioxin efflux transporter
MTGAAFGVAAAQAAFVNQLLIKLPTSAPSINPLTVVATGATELRSVFTAEEMPGILVAYVAGIKAAFAVTIGMVGLSFIFSLCSKWKKLNAHVNVGAGAA